MKLKKYEIIVIDPPWTIAKIKRRVRPNQKTMDYLMLNLDAIKKLPIGEIASDKAHCFLWTIDKYLFDAKVVLEAWGFNYHCTLAWNKTNGISLYGINRRVEFILVGLKGKHEAYPKRKTIPAAFTMKSERHSAKPDGFYTLLDVLPGNRIDMFARKTRENWDVWGNEVDSDIDITQYNQTLERTPKVAPLSLNRYTYGGIMNKIQIDAKDLQIWMQQTWHLYASYVLNDKLLRLWVNNLIEYRVVFGDDILYEGSQMSHAIAAWENA